MPPQTITAKRIFSDLDLKRRHLNYFSHQDPSFLRPSRFLDFPLATIDDAFASKMLGEATSGDPPAHMVDALIVGGGIPGISIAMSLARTLHSAVVFDSDIYETPLEHRPTGAAPQQNSQQFLDTARSLISTRYHSARFSDAHIVSISREQNEEGGTTFVASDTEGREWRGKKLVLAMGITLQFPELEGFETCWNKRIFENLVHRDVGTSPRSIGILAIDGDATVSRAYQLSTQAQNLTEQVTIYTNGNRTLASEIEASLPSGIEVNRRRISKLELAEEASEIKISWYDKSATSESLLIQKPKMKLNGPFAEQLDLTLTEAGTILTRFPFNETSATGVFAAGDCASPSRVATQSVVMGAFVAGGIQMQISGHNTIDATFNALQL